MTGKYPSGGQCRVGRRGRHPARPARAEIPPRAEIRCGDMLEGPKSTPAADLGYISMPHMLM